MTAPSPVPRAGDATFQLSRFLFLRLLGLCLAAAFLSLWEQAPGLIGSGGITPLVDTMAAHRARLGGVDPFAVPTLFWLGAGDAGIRLVAGLGLAAGVLLAIGALPRLCCAVAWLALLSFCATENGHGGYQWFVWPFDELLLEVTFVTVLLAPPGFAPRPGREPPVGRLPRLLLYYALFRLLLGSGITKATLAVDAWTSGAALRWFLETMPCPTASAAALTELPMWLLAVAATGVLVFELVGPLLLWFPGWPRRVVAAVGIVMMVGIQWVGNFRGLNLLTIGLLLLLVDDATWRALLPKGLVRGTSLFAAPDAAAAGGAPPARTPRLHVAAAALVVLASLAPSLRLLGLGGVATSPPCSWIDAAARPFHLAASYSLFCIVPSARRVVVLEGSNDGHTWQEYQPRAAPARVDRAPPRMAPRQDYLSFSLWLAGIAPTMTERWMPQLVQRLLEGAPAVQGLFAEVPFAGRPPQLLRVASARYGYASADERTAGRFWSREPSATPPAVFTLVDGVAVPVPVPMTVTVPVTVPVQAAAPIKASAACRVRIR